MIKRQVLNKIYYDLSPTIYIQRYTLNKQTEYPSIRRDKLRSTGGCTSDSEYRRHEEFVRPEQTICDQTEAELQC